MEPPPLLPGSRVGPWRVVSRRGQGAYGIIYQVEREGQADAGPFALKLATSPLDPRYAREAELLSRLHHPHVPRLHDRGQWACEDGMAYPFLVMDWVEGVTLYEWATRHRFTSRQALVLLAQVARALEATHEVGGAHRDIKGDNVLVRGEDNHAVLMDFGAGDIRGARRLTRETLPPGTPEYRSPEALRFQWRWRRHAAARYQAGPADDVYALGVMAYRMVTGVYPPPVLPPEAAEVTGESGPVLVPPEEVATVCPELAVLIRQMLSVDPGARGSAGELAERLEHAARSAGTAADERITACPVGSPSEHTARPGASRRAGLRILAAMAAGMALVVIGTWWGPRQTVGLQEPLPVGGEDGGHTGAGDAALPPPEAPSESMARGMGLEVPKKPFPGQRRPPCARPGVEIHGGCWLSVNEVTPPCGDQFYEWRNRCYAPIHGPPRPDTSGQPQGL